MIIATGCSSERRARDSTEVQFAADATGRIGTPPRTDAVPRRMVAEMTWIYKAYRYQFLTFHHYG